MFNFFHILGIRIPTDFYIFQRGTVGIPPTRYCISYSNPYSKMFDVNYISTYNIYIIYIYIHYLLIFSDNHIKIAIYIAIYK